MPDAREIARMLAAEIDALVREILPHGHREGAEWVHPSLTSSSSRSLSIRLTGQKRGVWSDFSSGDKGDALGLVAYVLHHGDRRAALHWACRRHGLATTNAEPTAQATPATRPPAVAEPRDDTDAQRRQRAAQALFLGAQPQILNTPVWAYLRTRGIDLGELRRFPRALRYHPALWNGETGRPLPAMVAAVTNGDGEMVAIHRTWLERDAHGLWRKARLRNPKMSLGTLAGGTIRIWRGASRKPLAQAPDGERLILTEGLEDALSCALLCPESRVLCAVSLSNMRHVALPTAVHEVTLAADNDGDNLAAARALQRVVDHFSRGGRCVRIARSPAGKDFNDLLMADLA